MSMGWEARKQRSDLEWSIAKSKAMAVLARRQGLPSWEAVQMEWGQRKAAGVLGGETRVQLQLLLASYAEPESDTAGEESGDTEEEEEEEGGCAHSSAYITRSRCEQPVPSKLVSDDSDAGSGSDCDGWVFDDDGGYGQDEAYELFQWAVE